MGEALVSVFGTKQSLPQLIVVMIIMSVGL